VTVHAPPDATLDPQLFLSVAEGIDAVNCDPPTNVVVRGLPFHFTTAPETNPVPWAQSSSQMPTIVQLTADTE